MKGNAVTDRDALLRILNDSGSYESMEAVADAILTLLVRPHVHSHYETGMKWDDKRGGYVHSHALEREADGLETS